MSWINQLEQEEGCPRYDNCEKGKKLILKKMIGAAAGDWSAKHHETEDREQDTSHTGDAAEMFSQESTHHTASKCKNEITDPEYAARHSVPSRGNETLT